MIRQQIVGSIVGLVIIAVAVVALAWIGVADGQNFRTRCVESGGYVILQSQAVCSR